MLPSFIKPLPKANVAGGWGDPRPAFVGSYHYAIDMPTSPGTPIYAAQDGKVIRAVHSGGGSAGLHVVVAKDGVATRYLHMSKVLVSLGDQVRRGQTIGLVGTTGFSSAPHLHLDVFLSPSKLAEYKASHPKPSPTYPSAREWGTAVPAEPLIPVDSYTDRVKRNAAKRGVPLYSPSPIGAVLVAAGAGYLAYKMFVRRKR